MSPRPRGRQAPAAPQAVDGGLAQSVARVLHVGYGLRLSGPIQRIEGPPDVERYACATNAGSFVLRFFSPAHSPDVLERSLAIVEALVNSGFPTAAPLATREERKLATIGGRHAALFYAVEGRPVGSAPRDLSAIGHVVGRLHFLCSFEDAATLQKLPLRSAIEARLTHVARLDGMLSPAAAEAMTALQERLAYLELPAALPDGILHGALTAESLVWSDDGELFIGDGDVFAHGPQLLDLALVASQRCFGPPEAPALKEGLLAALVEGYSLGSRRKVWMEEWQALPLLIYYGALLLASSQLADQAAALRAPADLPAWRTLLAIEEGWDAFAARLVELGMDQLAPGRDDL
jgi:Ser/Thr protein kinase RdoA (MazF antagonist)